MRVVVADDSVLLREGVVRLLEEKGFDVVAQAGDAEDLIRKVNAHKPDVAVVDIRMPPTNTDDGLRAALEIRASHPDTGVLVLSQYVEEGYALDLAWSPDSRRVIVTTGDTRVVVVDATATDPTVGTRLDGTTADGRPDVCP